MPSIRNRQQLIANGHQTANSETKLRKDSASGGSKLTVENGAALLSKKLQLIEEEELNSNNIYNDNNNNNSNSNGYGSTKSNKPQSNEDVFLDTCSSGAHKSSATEEPIVIFDGQSNTSIAQTAKDQFAAALLRLQANLDDSTKRLVDIEAKVDDIVKQQQRGKQTTKASQQAGQKGKLGPFGGAGQVSSALLYLSWPILVYFAMRAIERRSLANKV